MMQQACRRLKLCQASWIPNFDYSTSTRVPLSFFVGSKEAFNVEKSFTEIQCLENNRIGTKSLPNRWKTKKRLEYDLQCSSRISNSTRRLSRERLLGRIDSFNQNRSTFKLQRTSSCVQCCRTFNTVCPNQKLLNYGYPFWGVHLSYHCRNLWDIHRRINFGNYAVLNKPGEVYEAQQVPAHISCPPYFETGKPTPGPVYPEIKASSQVDAMRDSCRIARSILNAVGKNIRVGMSTEEIDALAHDEIIKNKAYPSPLNYLGFPKSVCTSVNNVACHGIPDDRQLVDGDIISVDVTVFYNGYHGDCCETYIIGNVDKAGRHLVAAARRCRDEAIAICGPGVPFAAVGAKVEEIARDEKVTVVPCFVGHGIGQYFHGPPDIYHCYNEYPGTMEEGMTFTIEPIVAQGTEEALLLEDGWTAVMLDNGRAAQFEHTILITEKGHEILSEYY